MTARDSIAWIPNSWGTWGVRCSSTSRRTPAPGSRKTPAPGSRRRPTPATGLPEPRQASRVGEPGAEVLLPGADTLAGPDHGLGPAAGRQLPRVR
jgi:hypothetical protein